MSAVEEKVTDTINRYKTNEFQYNYAARSSPNSIADSSVGYAQFLWQKADDSGSSSSAMLNDDGAPNNVYLWSSEKIDNEIKNQSKLLCNALKGSKSGSAVRIEDVSPVNEELKIKLTSDTVTDFSGISLKALGKNLFDYDYYKNNAREYNGITWTVNDDGTVTANGTATNQSFIGLRAISALPAGQYFLSGCPAGGTGGTYSIYLSNLDYTFYKVDYGNGCSIKMDEDKRVNAFINIGKGTTVNNMVFKPQLELGAAATEYEKGKKAKTYTPNTDGTVEGLTAVSPTTTLTTDNSGVVLNCEYNRDINKAFAELQQAIISLGGNI